MAIVSTNLPAPLTRFVGREAELARAAALLAEARLLTLTGPGGPARRCWPSSSASVVAEQFPDGVWFVAFSPLSATVTPTAADSRNLFLIFISPLLVKLISVAGRAILPRRLGASHRVNPYISSWA